MLYFTSCRSRILLKLAGDDVKLEEFRKYMQSKMKITILHDEWEKNESPSVKKKITLAINQELATIQNFDLQVITFRKEDWRSQKVIGSEAFIREKYRQWDKLTSA